MVNTDSILKIEIKDKVILVTGGYGHLGKQIVLNLEAHGSVVYVLGRDKTKFDQAFDSNGKIHFQECDIQSEDSIYSAIQEVYAREKRLDGVINNAFYQRGQNPETMSDIEFTSALEGSITSSYRVIKAVIPILKKQNFGSIINLGSMYGVVAPQFEVYDHFPQFINPPHYGAAKAGLIQLTKYYANYLGGYNIRVNSVSPGPFPSAAVQENKSFVKELAQKTALKRIGQSNELAGIFTFLCSDASRYLTGQNIIIDGGWTSK